MLKLVHSMLPAILIAILISPIVLSQDRSTAIEAIQNESDEMRKELIQRYRSSPLFGELLSKNSKIKGAARRLNEKIDAKTDWRDETKQLDQLLFDLESKIEEANFQASIKESKTVALHLGNMIANVELLKNGIEDAVTILDRPIDLQGPEFGLSLPEAQEPDALNSPLILGPEIDTDPGALNLPPVLGPSPEVELLPSPDSGYVELPEVPMVQPVPGELVLPELTIPTPENSIADGGNQRVLKPQLDQQSQHGLQPLDNRNQAPAQVPRLQGPQALSYGGRYVQPRTRVFSTPIQVEVFTFSRGGFGYQPYGGYRGGYGGYRAYGGYGGGRSCPYGR